MKALGTALDGMFPASVDMEDLLGDMEALEVSVYIHVHVHVYMFTMCKVTKHVHVYVYICVYIYTSTVMYLPYMGQTMHSTF